MKIKKKFKSSLSTFMCAVIAAGIFTGASTLESIDANADNSDSKYKIMCIGDSITDGYIDSNNGYRKYLCYYLDQNYISYDMVGAKNNWTNEAEYNWNGINIKYDPAHCGYSGYAIKQYNGRSGLYETLFSGENLIKSNDPDIILLQIGTNDLLDARLDIVPNTGDITSEITAIQRLENLVDEIILNMDNTDMLFLASIPDIDAEIRSDWLSSYGYILGVNTSNTTELQSKVDECIDNYNAGVRALVERKKSEGINIGFADVNSAVDMKTGLYDGVHPNEEGYAAMGKLWSDTIKYYIDNSDIVTTQTETTTTTEATTTNTIETITTTETTTTNTTETTTATETTTTNTPETTTITETTTTNTTENTSTTETSATTTTKSDLGDLNWDGKIDMSDCIALRKYLIGVTSIYNINAKNGDMDQNNILNIFDASLLMEIIINDMSIG